MNKPSKYYRSSIAFLGCLVFVYGVVVWFKVALDGHLGAFRRDTIGTIKQDRLQYRSDLRLITASLKRIDAQLGLIAEKLASIEKEPVDVMNMGADSRSSTADLMGNRTPSQERKFNPDQEAVASRDESTFKLPAGLEMAIPDHDEGMVSLETYRQVTEYLESLTEVEMAILDVRKEVLLSESLLAARATGGVADGEIESLMSNAAGREQMERAMTLFAGYEMMITERSILGNNHTFGEVNGEEESNLVEQ